MNQTAAIRAFEQNQKISGLRELLAFVGLPSKSAAKELPEKAVKMLCGIREIIDNLLLRAVEKRSAEEFTTTRDEVFGDYFQAMLAISNVAKLLIPPASINRLLWETFSEREADLRDHGLARFGAAARDQAIFTIWTLRKSHALALEIRDAAPLRAELRAQDRKLIEEFSFYSAWAQFHYDCLLASEQFDQPIQPEVLDEIVDGLRGAVNAYGIIRQGAVLRESAVEPVLQKYEWDDEDRELLQSSMNDMETEEW